MIILFWLPNISIIPKWKLELKSIFIEIYWLQFRLTIKLICHNWINNRINNRIFIYPNTKSTNAFVKWIFKSKIELIIGLGTL